MVLVQNDVYPRFCELLSGALAEQQVGDPMQVATDIGPVIDEAAQSTLQRHIQWLEKHGKCIARGKLHNDSNAGTFIAPCAYAIDSMDLLEREVFGPILHVVVYDGAQLDDVISQINRSGYGLTVGIHSRIQHTVEYIAARVNVGNCYVNRNMIGAIVGCQPFGGEGLSGTGPKAGGPNYLPRLCVERTLTANTTASGGNASLLALS